jgi:hypothetical protein
LFSCEIFLTFGWGLPFLFRHLWSLVYGKYLGNPVGKTLAQRFSLGFVSASAGFTADQLDRQICHTRVMEGVREVIEQHQALNHKITKEELFEIRRTMNEDCKNIPRVDQFSDTIKTMLGSLGKK